MNLLLILAYNKALHSYLGFERGIGLDVKFDFIVHTSLFLLISISVLPKKRHKRSRHPYP
jgi:hypothetical protein